MAIQQSGWRTITRASLTSAMALLCTTAAQARQGDTTRLHRLDAIVVTAERAAASIEVSTHAVSLLSALELQRRPARTIAEALRQVPGLAFVDFEGSGYDPQLMTRGFYGGGEADYVVVLVDGQPLNALETGRIPWDLVPLASVQSIEVVRGGASAAWGDAALAGVIDVITRRTSGRAGRVTLAGGHHGALEGSVGLADRWNGRAFTFSGAFTSSDGFRSHADRRTGGFTAALDLIDGPERALSLTTLHDWRGYDEPGPLTGTALDGSRTQSLPFYRFDHADERLHRVALSGRAGVGGGALLTGSLSGDYRHVERRRTIPLAPVFADTKDRVLSSARLIGSTQLAFDDLPLPGRDELRLGIDASLGRIGSEYHSVLSGSPDDYTAATGARGALAARGTGWRSAFAGFLGYALEVSPAVRLTLGGRLDWLRDTFEAEAPAATPRRDATHVAFSPRAGLNVRYLESERQTGHVYANIARAFKAPTPDQLFDQRTFPVPDPPFEIGFANDQLEPQHGTSVEAGVYHRAVIEPGSLALELTLSAYQMDLRDELDFDLATFRYQNIGRSRHRGVEAGVDLRGTGLLGGFARYTLQAVTSRAGENAGKRLKAIPRHFAVAGIDAGKDGGLAGSLIVSTARSIPLDDANTLDLPDWTRWDARLSYRAGRNRVFADVFNLFDAKFSTSGFPDSADPSVIHYYPAAGRTLRIGLSRDL